MHRIKQSKRLDRAVLQIAEIALKRHHPADIDVPQIHGRMAIDDPICENFAGAPCRADADRIEARRDEMIPYFGSFAEQIAIVWGEAFRSVEEKLNAGLSQHRHA